MRYAADRTSADDRAHRDAPRQARRPSATPAEAAGAPTPYKASADAPLAAALKRAVQQRARGLDGDLIRPSGQTERVLARERRVLISGNQFGETYHVALAMIMAKLNKQPILPAWLDADDQQGHTKTKPGQKAFLAKVYRWLNTHDLAPVETVGTPGRSAELLSNNEASGAVDAAIQAMASTPGATARAMTALRTMFLSDPDLALEMKPQNATRLAQEAAHDSHIRGVLDNFFNIALDPAHTLVARRQAQPRYVIFNRQQALGTERNLSPDIIDALVERVQFKHPGVEFLHNSSATEAFPVVARLNPAPRNIGAVVQAPPPNEWDSYSHQLRMWWILHREYGVVGHAGMKSGALDGPAMIGIPTIYFDTTKTGRLAPIAPHVGLMRVDLSTIGAVAPKNPKRARDAWRLEVMNQLTAHLP